MEILKVFKGTDKDMKCLGMQYEIGKKEVADDAIRCGSKGFHSCESPLDVLRYYPMRDGNRYFTAEAGGKIDRSGADDSKLASSELTLGAEIGFPGLVNAHIEWTRKQAESGTAGGDESNLAGGNESNIAGGNWSNLAGGNKSNLAGGNWSNIAGGYESNIAGGSCSLVVGRNGCKAKCGLHSVLVLTEWKWRGDDYVPVCVKAKIVDGKTIKADTYYELKNGRFVKCK